MIDDRLKFRVWDKEEKCYSTACFFLSCEGELYIFIGGVVHKANPEIYIVEKCTGLKDKNGKRIWENDIVSGYFNHKKITGFIKYGSNAVYYIEREGSYGIHLDNSEDWLEVIGNIFDNPELLKGE